jgi:transcriptional regulator with XRE-family HTH domain
VPALNRVREARLRAHLSQDELADKSGLARPTISKIERGETIPSGLSKQKIADALSQLIWDVFPENQPESLNAPERNQTSKIMGIAIVNGTMVAAGVRGTTTDQVAVREPRIEGFLIDRTGERCPNTLVHLVSDGEKVDTTVSGRQGRFVFKDVKQGDYLLLAEDRFQPVTVALNDDTFEFEV